MPLLSSGDAPSRVAGRLGPLPGVDTALLPSMPKRDSTVWVKPVAVVVHVRVARLDCSGHKPGLTVCSRRQSAKSMLSFLLLSKMQTLVVLLRTILVASLRFVAALLASLELCVVPSL